MINCIEFREQLASLIEEHGARTDVGSALSEHGERCKAPACRQVWDDFELLAPIIPVWQSSLPEASLEGRVVQLLRSRASGHPAPSETHGNVGGARPAALRSSRVSAAEPSPARLATPTQDSLLQSSRRSLGAVLATVACLGLLVPFLRIGSDSGSSVTQRASTTGREPIRANEMVAVPAAPRVVHGYARVPQSATELVTDTLVMFIPADLSDPKDEELSRPEQWRSRLGEQLEPIGHELGTAVDAFLEAVSKSPMRSI